MSGDDDVRRECRRGAEADEDLPLNRPCYGASQGEEEERREHDEERRQQSPGSTGIERSKRDRLLRSLFFEQQRGDQEPAEDEEEIDAERPSPRPAESVETDDERDRDPAYAVECAAVPEPHPLAPGSPAVWGHFADCRPQARTCVGPGKVRTRLRLVVVGGLEE